MIHKPAEKPVNHPGVSIIICSRNEEENLYKNLPKILNQDYPKFEVIVVIDQTVDDSKHIINAYSKEFPQLRYIEMERNQHRKFGKKIPLTVGIKGAKYEHVLLTDADCFPATDQWIKLMMSNYTEEKDIVIGYGPYERKKGLLNKFIRFDTTQIAATYLGFAKNRRPYMAVGRNMSYKVEKWREVDGFKSHYHVQSGDDDLFMQDAAKRKNTAIEIDKKSWVYSHPKTSWKDWVAQKQRHYTTASKYRFINKVFLGIFPFSMILMFVSLVLLLINYEWWLFVLSLFALRLITYWIISGLLFRKLGQKDLSWLFPIFEIGHFIIIPFIYYSTDRRPDKW
ncbi:glycosyltransferase [Paracrocinitomix mangrovi]|uniref:glycosyltransferase n=1 Tax=Paracrocinitomix mangrovi TaxID=2862509 RepID=UPI001C8D3A64|nr:glycosyltransferase [Paracrocinitomix mangrovi]UKN01390.1 glycosyltransferase [Paracrocinitomix mangrovi]